MNSLELQEIFVCECLRAQHARFQAFSGFSAFPLCLVSLPLCLVSLPLCLVSFTLCILRLIPCLPDHVFS